jgi:hypothetical protein
MNGTVWIPDSKTVNGVAEVPLTDIAVEAFRRQLQEMLKATTVHQEYRV